MAWVWKDEVDWDDEDACEEEEEFPRTPFRRTEENALMYDTLQELGTAHFAETAKEVSRLPSLYDLLKRNKIKFGG